MNSPSARTVSVVDSRSTVVATAGLAIVLGVFLIFVAGFAHPGALHNVVHDSRHAAAFPCH